MVRQDLEREHGLKVSLRTVERAVASLREQLAAKARATVRFERRPVGSSEAAIRRAIARGEKGKHKIVAEFGVGSGMLARIRAEMGVGE